MKLPEMIGSPDPDASGEPRTEPLPAICWGERRGWIEGRILGIRESAAPGHRSPECSRSIGRIVGRLRGTDDKGPQADDPWDDGQ